MKEATERAVPGWLDEVLEVGVRGTFEAKDTSFQRATAELQTGLTDSEVQHVFITLRVEPGALYRISEISFRSADSEQKVVFPLRKSYGNYFRFLTAICSALRKSGTVWTL